MTEPLFLDDDATQTLPDPGLAASPWKILVVDDDEDVFTATRFALDGLTILDRPLDLRHAGSADAAFQQLEAEPDYALVLLDVVMEHARSGLDLVERLRTGLGRDALRIVLRTGQPGYAPEQDTILRYDINDYRTKDELSQRRLVTTVATALRSYRQIRTLQANREGLEIIVRASTSFNLARGCDEFAASVITHLAALSGAQAGATASGLAVRAGAATDAPEQVLAATGRFEGQVGKPLSALADARVLDALHEAMRSLRSVPVQTGVALGFGVPGMPCMAAYVDLQGPLADETLQLLNVFATNLGATVHSMGLVERLHRQAYFDPLLGLPNRSNFIECLDRALCLAEPGVVALVDIDDFASVNDLMGHAYGDALLAAFAQRLQQHVGDGVTVARMNSNTFGLLGPASSVRPPLVTSAVQEPLVVQGRPHTVSLTCGFAALVAGVQGGAEWLKDVGIALKHAKRQLRGRHAEFTPSLGEEARGRARLLASLHEAFAENRLFVVYQPQLDLASGEVLGLEALMRWRTDDGRMVPPAEFIPVAEQSGLILPLGDWVLQVACAAMRELLDDGLAPRRMAVNVSVLQFQHTDFVTLIGDTLRRHGLTGSQIELEVTESVAAMGPQVVVARLTALRALGVSIAIDDFGTGYSSLSYLGELPVDRLKIDRAFVLQLEKAGGPRIAELVTQLGHTMGLRVLAEGIETEDVCDRLRAMGCHEGQGYLFARPLEMPDMRRWLEQRR
jgi:diguanylate cyclase (GGDEF)-like protein